MSVISSLPVVDEESGTRPSLRSGSRRSRTFTSFRTIEFWFYIKPTGRIGWRFPWSAGCSTAVRFSHPISLLVTLAQNVETVMTREKLLELVWGYDYYGETRTIDVHVNHLREKLADAAPTIETVRGIGYKLTSH